MSELILACMGTWILSDAIYSYALYSGEESWRGDPQTWAKDHWVRAVRGCIGLAMIVMAWL
jgi:hypothetical protein